MAAPTIVSTVPTSGAVSVPVNVEIEVIFDQEIDLYRLRNGGIILEGPDQSKSIGPAFIEMMPPNTDEDDLLTSPGYKGIVGVDYEFKRVDGSGAEVSYYDYGDTSGAGGIYRTKVVLTPTKPLAPLTEYTVFVVGDEDTTDAYDFGLSTRTIFDPRKGANFGNGEVVFYGSYSGSIRQQFFIEITVAGTAGTAEYEWWTSTDTVRLSAISTIGYRLLSDGVKIKFLQGLNFAVGDTFSVWCDVPVFMNGSSKFSFTTSNQSPTTLPVPSTSLIGGTGTGTTTSTFEVSSSNPSDRQSMVPYASTSYSVTFSGDIDASTITDSSVTLEGHPADDSISGVNYTATILKTLSVSGAILTITPTPIGQVYANNVVLITLDSSIADTSGTTLGADYTYFFGTTLTPFYAGIRQVLLRLGSAGNYFPEETIAFAIWEASRLATAYTPSAVLNSTVFTEARRQFVICYAAWILITSGAGGTGGSVRKRLGDFDVSRSESSIGGLDDALKDCWERYLEMLEGGGDIHGLEASRPVNVVKGDMSYDEPHYGRLWEIPSAPIANARVLYTDHRRWVRSNMTRGGYWWKFGNSDD
jgi:hypothetical protein